MNLDEKELVAKAQGGDESAFEALFASVHAIALKHAKRYLPDGDVEDGLQEMRLRLWLNLPHLDLNRHSLQAWASVVFRNLAIDLCRKRFRHPTEPFIPDSTDPSPRPDEAAIAKEERERLLELVRRIRSPLHRRAVELRFLCGMSIHEISEAMNCPENTAKVRVYRGRRALLSAAQRMGLAPRKPAFEQSQRRPRLNTELIDAKFDPSLLKERKGSYGKMLTYVETAAYIRRMNDVFGYEWSVEVVALWTESSEIIARVKVTANGIVKEHAGSKKISYTKQGEIISIGDDTKSAISNAFKKACQFFGIGLYIAEGDDDDDSATAHSGGNGNRPARVTQKVAGGITEEQIATIRELRTDMDWSQEDVKTLSRKLFKTDNVGSLNKTQANGLIAELRKLTDVAMQSAASQSAVEANY